MGTPIQTTDKAGNIVWAASYQAFGRATITTPQATRDKPTISSNLRLPGQYEDAETGLHYNFRRYYDPETGRYVTQDPIGLAGGINIYEYAKSNPLSFSDPTGENPAAIRAAIWAAIAAIKKCAGNKACRCRAVYAAYKPICLLPRSCKSENCGFMLEAKEKAARYCYQLRDLYIRMNCDAALPTPVNHPGERDNARDVWNVCKAKLQECREKECQP